MNQKVNYTIVNIIAFTVFTFLEYINIETARLWGVTGQIIQAEAFLESLQSLRSNEERTDARREL
jgi:hypothetical protein